MEFKVIKTNRGMNELIEGAVFWGSLLGGGVACLLAGWFLLGWVRQKKTGRFLAVIIYGCAAPFLGMVPVVVGYMTRWVGNLAGISIFPKTSADDGIMVGIGIMGILVAAGFAGLFILVMIFQAITDSGES